MTYRNRTGFFLALPLLLILGIAGPLRAQDAADIILRLDRLEAENRRLTGQLDEIRFQNRRLEDQLKRFQSDTDLRMRDIEGGRGAAPRANAPQAPARRSDAFDPVATPDSAGAPQPLGPGAAPAPAGQLSAGALPSGGRLVQDGELGAPLDVTNPRRPAPGPITNAPTVATANPAAPANPKTDFELARALIERGDNELAEGAFRDFLRSYPKNALVPDATFWLGESYLRRTRYREAAEQYLNVTSKYSNAARAPEAMLKLGISLRGLGAKQEACGTFAQVTKKYPSASPAIRQAVDREKARAQCSTS